LAITTDGWTSRATESYITITAHLIDKEWCMNSFVLQTRPLHESHTGKNIGAVLVDASKEWQLERPHKLLPIVTDNAANMDVAIQEAKFTPHIKCFAHTINLATQRGLQVHQMSRLLGRIRHIVSFFHRSATATNLLKSKQELLQLPKHKLIQDVKTRWNSSYDMIDRFLEQQPAIVATLLSKEIRQRETDLNTLSEDDVSNAEDILKLLKPMKTITTILCDEAAPTISMIFPLKHRIISAMEVQKM
jgi:hypothetical protein